MLNRKKDLKSARKKAAGSAYTKEVKSTTSPWLAKYLANKEVIVNNMPTPVLTSKEVDSTLPRLEKDYKILYESALSRIAELEKRLRNRIEKEDSQRIAGFGRGPKSIHFGGQPANATPKRKKLSRDRKG
jgi:hypothetical protein